MCRYLGFEIHKLPHKNWSWVAIRHGDAPVTIEAHTKRDLRKYLRAIRAAERTNTIR